MGILISQCWVPLGVCGRAVSACFCSLVLPYTKGGPAFVFVFFIQGKSKG